MLRGLLFVTGILSSYHVESSWPQVFVFVIDAISAPPKLRISYNASCPQAEKIIHADALDEYVRCVHCCKQNVENLKALETLREDKARSLAVQKLLALVPDIVFKEWKVYPQFDEWMLEQEKIKLRQDVCVLVGPTKTGKTEFAMAKCGKDTLVVNCHKVVEPDLRKFAGAHIHKSIILDEGGPELLSLHRDLLQASRRDITLGHSSTNRWTYTVNLYRVRVIITSNEWYDQLAKLSEKDQHWIEGNTVMINIDSPTFLSEEQALFMILLVLHGISSCFSYTE